MFPMLFMGGLPQPRPLSVNLYVIGCLGDAAAGGVAFADVAAATAVAASAAAALADVAAASAAAASAAAASAAAAALRFASFFWRRFFAFFCCGAAAGKRYAPGSSIDVDAGVGAADKGGVAICAGDFTQFES